MPGVTHAASGRVSQMRIISGRFGGRDLGSVPEGVRPTSDRVRESLFSTLGSVEGVRVLDLLAGTGALGRESISRGAQRVVFVERSRRIARDLQARLDLLGLGDSDQVRLMTLDASKAIRRLEKEGDERFDLVESSGVLHHMEDPQEGWRILTGLVKPGGLMKIALYSEIARQDVVAARYSSVEAHLRIKEALTGVSE